MHTDGHGHSHKSLILLLRWSHMKFLLFFCKFCFFPKILFLPLFFFILCVKIFANFIIRDAFMN